MDIEIFDLERLQSLYENVVEYNLTESGLHPFTLRELLTEQEIEDLKDIRIGYGQTNGSIQLRETISRLYPGADKKNILVTNGTAEANFIAMWSNLKSGDEMVLMLPNYMQIWGWVRSFGVKVNPFHLKEELKWAPDLEELKKQVTPKTKIIALCNPNNPTGATLSEQDMREIVSIAKGVGAWIYCDEVYRGAELDGNEIPTFYGMYEKVLVNGGLSKAYGLPGLRMGWLVGPEEKIENAWSFNDYVTISTGILSQKVAEKVLQPKMREKVLNRNRGMLRENIKVVQEWADSHKDLFSFVPPKAGGMAFLKYNMKINSRKLADKLRLEKGVFVMDGDCFGMDHYIRIGFGAEKNYLIAGLKRITELLKEIISPKYKFDWEGGLKDANIKQTSVELQHEAAKWRK
jgi:aspartate/methionine/tyrosine aminotransferase